MKSIVHGIKKNNDLLYNDDHASKPLFFSYHEKGR